MKRRVLVLAAMLTISLTGMEAQPGTSFWPHHVGDRWQYFVLDGVGNDTLQTTVVFDSTDPTGSSHVRHRRELLNPIRPPWFQWYDEFRIDTNANVFGSGFLPPNSLVYRLSAQVGQWWFVAYHGGSGGDVARIIGEYPDTIFGRPSVVKEIGYFSASDTSDTTIWLLQYTDVVAAGFGPIFRGGGDLGYSLYLIGCVIDGIVYGDTILVSVSGSHEGGLADDYMLYQNFPNPFNPTTQISYTLPVAANVSLVLQDILGRQVAQLENGHRAAGVHHVAWNAQGQPSGVYFCRMEVNGSSFTRKLVLIR